MDGGRRAAGRGAWPRWRVLGGQHWRGAGAPGRSWDRVLGGQLAEVRQVGQDWGAVSGWQGAQARTALEGRLGEDRAGRQPFREGDGCWKGHSGEGLGR